MSSLLGFDFDGTIISQVAAREANRRFFCHMRELLDDETLSEGSGSDYLEPVLAVMAKFHGKPAKNDAERASYLAEARRIYRTFLFEILMNDASEVFHKEVILLLRSQKGKGKRLALISTSPKFIVEPALALLGINDLFDIVLASPGDMLLSKEEMLRSFKKLHGSLACYVGDEDGDEQGAMKNKIPFFRFEERRTTRKELECFLQGLPSDLELLHEG